MPKDQYQILLTNDDGIDSPGLWAAAEALSEIGYVTVAAPRDQASGTGRSMPPSSDGRITARELVVHGKTWTVYAVGGTPAQTVQHAILELMDRPPDLLVSGINYGSNLGTGVTVSGTVGAALEGASHHIPSLAISLETDTRYHLSYSDDIDFSSAAYFTTYFAHAYLHSKLDPDVQALKIEIPSDATPGTPWEMTRLSTVRYYLPKPQERLSLDESKPIGYDLQGDLGVFPQDSDVYAVMVKRVVAVTPLTLDMTSRVPLPVVEKQLRANQ